MNKAIKEKAKYVVRAEAGTDKSEGHSFLIRWILKAIHRLKTEYWLAKVNRMSEGQVMDMYYELTRREENDAISISERSEGYIED